MAQVMKDIVTWLKQWFYTEDEVDTKVQGLQSQINNKADTSTVSNLTTTVGLKADKTGGVQQITDNNAHANIGTSAGATQSAINTAIDNKIGTLISVDWIQVVSTLPTASASTMGKLYLVAKSGATGDNVFIEYVTVKQGSSYTWEKLGELSGSGLSVEWGDITGKPDTFPPATHNHDNLYYTESEVNTLLADKLDSDDYVVDSALSSTSTNPVQNKVINTQLGLKSAKTETIDINDIILVDKGETNEGCIIFNTIS